MEIYVDIGTPEQQKFIRDELKNFETLQKEISGFKSLKKLFISADFDSKVNELEGTRSYISQRDTIHAMAKNIKINDGYAIVVNAILYTDNYDFHIRYLVLLHEMFHIILNIDAMGDESLRGADASYRANLGILFDDYCANRASMEIHFKIFTDPSYKFKKFLIRSFHSFLKGLIDDIEFYEPIVSEIENFQDHGDVELFLANIQRPFDGCSKSIIYAFAYMDACSHFKNKENHLVSNSRFVNSQTLELIDYFRKKYETKNYDLEDQLGLSLIIEFMTIFGFELENTKKGLYVHVFDI